MKSPSPVVLVVERDRLLRWALYETLVEAGFRVLTAPESLTAAALVREIDQDPSLAILDDEACPLTTDMRATLTLRTATMPIVVMYHSPTDDRAEQRARDRGAVEVLEKPFDLHDVVALAQRLTGSPDAPLVVRTSGEKAAR